MKIIKKEIVIDAPVAKVWEYIVDPKKLARWLMPNDFEARIGMTFSMECPTGTTIACVVKEILPPEKLVYSFKSNEMNIETLVTFLLAPEGNGTRLTLVHSGWDSLPPSEQEEIAGGFDEGWGRFLGKLEAEFAAAAK